MQLTRTWQFAEPDEAQVARFASTAELPPPVARVLVNRGVTEEDLLSFLDPKLDRLSDPFLMPGMEDAVDRIWIAIDGGESILIYGDYDVDGVTSTALMLNVLRDLGAEKLDHFIPHRIDDGYGLTPETMQAVHEQAHPGLVITVDCGTGSVEAVELGEELGIDVIVTDHHETSAGVAPALAVVNPKLGEAEDLHILAGVGVAFKLCHALIKAGREDGRKVATSIDLRKYMYLVSMGTIADMVPLVKENRILARYGLDAMNRKTPIGLQALSKVAAITDAISSYHIGFLIGPRINAAGRMSESDRALECLMETQLDHAMEIAGELDAANKERQQTEQEIVEAALQEIETYFDPATTFAIVAGQPGWHPGVVGIVASRIVQQYHRPAVIIGVDENGKGKGSCRSISGFDLVAGLGEADDLLNKYGGHKMAAGLEIDVANIPAFRERLNEVAKKAFAGVPPNPVLKIDSWLDTGDMTFQMVDAIERLMPFGLGNATPVWACQDVVVERKREVGKGHLKLALFKDGQMFEAIGFNMFDREIPDRIDIVFQLKRNVYKGLQNLELVLQDLRPCAGD
ncbi:MAG: single-stranded-DNA-specific exonuclease [Candidatus Omnitrophota bacterium]|jgi:single-stranded-DNA-specific exonuclease